MKRVRIKREAGVSLPEYATPGSSGADVRARLDGDVVVRPHSVSLIPTGFCIEIPDGYEVQIRSRSGLSLKDGIIVLNSPGTIDSDYRGEVKVMLFNVSDNPFTVRNGDRIAQMVLSRVERMEFEDGDLSETRRGRSGFGGTGV